MSRAGIHDNEANLGGGIFNDRGILVMNDNTAVSDNLAISGGGILNTGAGAELSFVYGRITQNIASTDLLDGGGGLFNRDGAWAYLEEVVLIENHAQVCGGGIWNRDAFFSIHRSSLVLNTAPTGAGLCSSSSGTLNGPITDIVNSTFSENISLEMGGAIFVSGGTYHLINVTVADNQGASGAGLYILDGSMILENTLLARNSGSNCAGLPPGSGGNNLEDIDTCDLGMPGDVIDPAPLLGGLEEIGALMHPLLPDSPAIDAGASDVCPATDQRGVIRPQGTTCDIGAYEMEGVQPRLVPTGTPTWLPSPTWTPRPPAPQGITPPTPTLPVISTLQPMLPSSTPVP